MPGRVYRARLSDEDGRQLRRNDLLQRLGLQLLFGLVRHLVVYAVRLLPERLYRDGLPKPNREQLQRIDHLRCLGLQQLQCIMRHEHIDGIGFVPERLHRYRLPRQDRRQLRRHDELRRLGLQQLLAYEWKWWSKPSVWFEHYNGIGRVPDGLYRFGLPRSDDQHLHLDDVIRCLGLLGLHVMHFDEYD